MVILHPTWSTIYTEKESDMRTRASIIPPACSSFSWMRLYNFTSRPGPARPGPAYFTNFTVVVRAFDLWSSHQIKFSLSPDITRVNWQQEPKTGEYDNIALICSQMTSWQGQRMNARLILHIVSVIGATHLLVCTYTAVGRVTPATQSMCQIISQSAQSDSH